MSTTRADIWSAIRKWVVAVCGVADNKVLWAGQQGPAEVHPITLLTKLAFPRIAADEVRALPNYDFNDSDQFFAVGQYEPTLSIETIGANAGNVTALIQSRMYLDEYEDYLKKQRKVKIEVLSYEDSTDYLVSLEGISVVVTSTSGGSEESVRDAFVTAFNSISSITGVSAAPIEGTSALMLTGKLGMEFDVETDMEDLLTVTNIQEALYIVVVEELSTIEDVLPEDTQYEERSSIDIRFRSALRAVTRPGVIERVEVTEGLTGKVWVLPEGTE